MATSSMVASPEPSARVTRRPSTSARIRVSLARCSKRRTLMSPVVMTCPEPTDTTRPIERNTRRRPGISTTKPTTRGGAALRYTTTTSRTLPSRSPSRSNTTQPARRATNRRVLMIPKGMAEPFVAGAGGTSAVHRGSFRLPHTPHGGRWDDVRMTNPAGPFGTSRRPGFPVPPRGEVIANYDTYEAAQDAVDKLAHADFQVRSASIVGNDLKSVERVTGRLSWGRAAGAGAASGLWLGLFLGIVTVTFSTTAGPGYLFGAVLIGAAFGMLFGLVSYALTRSRRDFSSVMQVVASSYSLIVDPEVATRARNVLGLAAGSTTTTTGIADAGLDEPPLGPT